MKVKIVVPAQPFFQGAREVSVNFDNVELCTALKQRAGQCSLPGADFDDQFAGLRIDCSDDAIDNTLIMEKILPKSFARVVLHGRDSRAAMEMASMRLLASALPVPAISRAVP